MWSSSSLMWAIVTLISFVIFRKPICNILNSFANFGNKAQKVKYKNFSLDLVDSNPTLFGTQQEYADTKHLEYLKTYQSNVVTLEENLIRNQLTESKMTEGKALDILICHLANAHLQNKLLMINQLIFKEQIELLMHLNTQVKPLPESELLSFYERWKKNLKNKSDYTFKNFLGFLSQQGLITLGIDGYSIGLIGKEYLSFLIRIGRKT